MENFLLKLVQLTDGWVLVVLWISFLGYRTWENHEKERKNIKSLEIIDGTLKSILTGIMERLGNIIDIFRGE